MRKTITTILFVCTSWAMALDDRLQRITPEKAGYSSEKLKELKQYLIEHGSSSMMLMYDGQVFFEWGDIYQKHTVHSIRKALINSLVGIYHEKGVLPLDKNLSAFGIDDIHSLSKTERSATLRELLQSRSGIYHDAAADSEGMRKSRPQRHSHQPGEFYYYNNWNFNAVGAILEQETEQSVFDLFNHHIAKPLGMHYGNQIETMIEGKHTDIPNSDGFYYFEPQRSKFPAYHFRLSAYDLALYGQLFLNRGKWNNQQLIPEDWVDLTTKPHSIYNEKYGLSYGMFWYSLVPDENDPSPPSFYHTGTGVHMLGVYPKHKLVMVHRVDTEKEYRFQGRHLYPLIRLMHGARMKEEENNVVEELTQ